MRNARMRRRTVLAAGAAGFALPLPLPALAAAASPALRTVRVEGTDLTVSLLPGPVTAALVQVIRRFHYEIESLRPGDVMATAAGTAVDIRPGAYPPGVRGGFLPHQEVVLRDIVARSDGLVRWGGDLASPAESRFAVAVRAGDPRLAALAARLRHRSETPGAGMAAPFTPARVRRAAAYRR